MRPTSCKTQKAYKWGNGGVGWPLGNWDVVECMTLHALPEIARPISNRSNKEICFLMISALPSRDDQHDSGAGL